MNNAREMSTADIYRHLRTHKFDSRRTDHLVDDFDRAAKFLRHKIEHDGWKWRSNYLREHAGCAFGAQFTNTVSPYILELLFRKVPMWRKYDEGGSNDPQLF
jgi:hypothetical protein